MRPNRFAIAGLIATALLHPGAGAAQVSPPGNTAAGPPVRIRPGSAQDRSRRQPGPPAARGPKSGLLLPAQSEIQVDLAMNNPEMAPAPGRDPRERIVALRMLEGRLPGLAPADAL